MSILVNGDTRLLVQGIGSRTGTLYAEHVLGSGTHLVAGVEFGQGGTWFSTVPVFDSCREAVHATDANASLLCVQSPLAAEAVLEAADAGLDLVICITPDLPAQDVVLIEACLAQTDTMMLGPGSVGAFSPGQCLAGVLPQGIAKPGGIGVVSRSGSLAYEVTWGLSRAGLGQSTILSIGGGTIVGLGFDEILAMFEDDPVTRMVVLIGEVGGQEEEWAAEFVPDGMTKPVVAMVTGRTSPPGQQMGHPGAIIEGVTDTAQHKISLLENAGVDVARCPAEIIELVKRRMR